MEKFFAQLSYCCNRSGFHLIRRNPVYLAQEKIINLTVGILGIGHMDLCESATFIRYFEMVVVPGGLGWEL